MERKSYLIYRNKENGPYWFPVNERGEKAPYSPHYWNERPAGDYALDLKDVALDSRIFFSDGEIVGVQCFVNGQPRGITMFRVSSVPRPAFKLEKIS